MSLFRPTLRRAAVLAFAAIFVSACSDDTPSGPEPTVSFGKGGKGPGGGGGKPAEVSEAIPPYGQRGAIALAVRIEGSGFELGDEAEWERDGLSGGVTTTQTVFVSSSELEATIDISSEADLAFYDIAIYRGGKKGIGTELVTGDDLFEVTEAEVIDCQCSQAREVNDLGHVVGWASAERGFVWAPERGAVEYLDGGVAHDIDEAGSIVVGATVASSNDSYPVIWQRSGGTWGSPIVLPHTDFGAARAVASDGDGNAVVIAGGDRTQLKRNKFVTTPALWFRQADETWALELLDVVVEGEGGTAWAVHESGIAAGTTASGAVFWEADGSVTRLPGGPGTRATGMAVIGNEIRVVGWDWDLQIPLVWTRDLAGGPWSSQALPLYGNTAGHTEDINALGWIAGRVAGKWGAVWIPDGVGGYTLQVLGTTGTHSAAASAKAFAINGSTSNQGPIAAGVVGNFDTPAIWRLGSP